MEKKTSTGLFAPLGMGCAIQIVLLIILAVTLKDWNSIAVYAIMFSLPALIIRLFIRKHKPSLLIETLLGPVLFVVAIVLGLFFPIDMQDDEMTSDVSSNPPIEEQATQHTSSNEKKLEPPPGVKVTEPNTNTITNLDQAIAQLNELIGLVPVKEEVKKFADFVRVAQMRKEKGLKIAPITYHMVFSGNPGTGKTTVARIMADIYRTLGVVKKGHLVECDRGGLIAGYVGQTAIKTGQVIDYALDGVLFIDEAYSITEGGEGYGAECIATLLKRMEDDRDRLVVIIAGYTDEMKRFIDSNPGLQSRFSHYIDFPDYSAQELAAIFRMNAARNQYILSPELDNTLDDLIKVKTQKRDRQFGNARWVRNLLDDAIVKQATRLSGLSNLSTNELMTLTIEDVGAK